MRFKINVKVKNLTLDNVASETAKIVHTLLGENNKWHDLERKPFTSSFILGGSVENKSFTFKEKPYIYINTEDNEVIDALMKNTDIEFSIELTKVFNGYNFLSVKRVVYNTGGKKNWITPENKDNFIQYVKTKYGVNIQILKIKNTLVSYKSSKLPVSDLLIKCDYNKNVSNLFESGLGGSCSVGFGFVESLYK